MWSWSRGGTRAAGCCERARGEAVSVPAAGVQETAPALSVQGLGKRYGERIALQGVDLEVMAGEMVAVVGPNGAGKTTLLSIVAGVQAASEGTVSRDAREVGWVPQQPAIYSKLTVTENLRLFARLERVADVQGTVQGMLEQTGLAKRAHERLQRLSGGNRQRVNVAVGLLADPPVIALDEPSTALDPTQRARLWDFIAGIAARGSAVLFSTHIVEEAQRYAHRVLVLDHGRRRFFGAPAQLAADQPQAHDFESALVSFLASPES
jgi:ABC-2 type transport system ATP-binding protein